MNKFGININCCVVLFIEESNIIHNNKYIYSKTDYITVNDKVIITCKEHGDFLQKPNHHLFGQGCPNCRKNKKLSLFDVIERSNKIHNNKYNYSLSDYKNIRTKIKILCPIHGIFEQLPDNHMSGQGCYKCGIKKIDIDYFILKCSKIHNDRYDYSLISEIKNDKEKVNIICPTHGVFQQRVSQHLNGQICRRCFNTKQRVDINNKIGLGDWCVPNFNKNACFLFDKISQEKNINIKHALNGGEFQIKELGYWVDGYDEINNIVYEFYENSHFTKSKMKKDLCRENEIKQFLKCDLIIIKEEKR